MLDIDSMEFTETPHHALTKSGRKGRATGDVLIHGELRFESTARVTRHVGDKVGAREAAKALMKRAMWKKCYEEVRDLAMELHSELSYATIYPENTSLHRAERLTDTLLEMLSYPKDSSK